MFSLTSAGLESGFPAPRCLPLFSDNLYLLFVADAPFWTPSDRLVRIFCRELKKLHMGMYEDFFKLGSIDFLLFLVPFAYKPYELRTTVGN